MTHHEKRPVGVESAGRRGTSKGPRDSHPNTAAAQRSRLLAALRLGPLTTIAARRDLDVLHPGARVLELRRAGNPIVTHWRAEPTDCGRLHRVGVYTLGGAA